MSVENTQAEKLDELPLGMDNTKAEIVRHLIDVHHPGQRGFNLHNQWVGHKDTKATKQELLNYHDRIHKVLDSPDRTHKQYLHRDYETANMWYLHENDTDYATHQAHVPTTDHVHVPLPVEPALVAMSEKVQEDGEANVPVAGKPLSAAERKILNELIVNDFNGLKAETAAYVNEQWSMQLKELNEEWDAKEQAASKLLDKATKVKRAHLKARDELLLKQEDEARVLRTRHDAAAAALDEKQEDEWSAIVADASEDGIDLIQKARKVPDKEDPKKEVKELYYEAKALGRDEAIAAAKAEINRQKDQAFVRLDQQRLAAQRKVLVSGVSHDAAKILEGIPSAKEMMAAALGGAPMKELN